MSKDIAKALEAAGWRDGDAADFLELTDTERIMLDLRVSMAKAVREGRKSLSISQVDLAKRMRTSQPRVAKIEAAAADVSMDQLVRAILITGGSVNVSGIVVAAGGKEHVGHLSGLNYVKLGSAMETVAGVKTTTVGTKAKGGRSKVKSPVKPAGKLRAGDVVVK